ncbi:MAG: hypothetical protein GEU74_01075 [Nitriliruptorales bacterium]|nr:hypothetical protein [Nitriliruptorales bacterium]
MGEYEQELEQARQAFAEQDWPVAADHYGMVPFDELTSDDLVALGQAEWYLGRFDESARANAAAFEELVTASRPAEAAEVALLQAYIFLVRADEPQMVGWIGRAGQQLEGLPEGPSHGHLLFFTEVLSNLLDRPASAVDAARRVQDLGHRHDAPRLRAQGISAEGCALVRMGQIVDGISRLDESLVAVRDDRISPLFVGQVYCFAVETCRAVGEFGRVARWTQTTEEWLSEQAAAFQWGGMCRLSRAALDLLRGAWEKAEHAALETAEEFDGKYVLFCAEAWYLVGDARRLRGDATAAEAYDEAHARGRDPQPGRALLQLQQGDERGAATSVQTALAAAGDNPFVRAPICAAAVEINLAAGRPDLAAAAESELAETAAGCATSGLQAMAASARGAMLLAQGHAEQALPVLRDSCRRWLDLGAQYDAAGTCLQLAKAYRALGDETSAAAEIARAQKTYQRLGLEWSAPEQPAPDGLTERECEVLALVADGRTNKQIGEELFISNRTVGRHLTNIFHKINVTSRTQAARYALEHGIASTP